MQKRRAFGGRGRTGHRRRHRHRRRPFGLVVERRLELVGEAVVERRVTAEVRRAQDSRKDDARRADEQTTSEPQKERQPRGDFQQRKRRARQRRPARGHVEARRLGARLLCTLDTAAAKEPRQAAAAARAAAERAVFALPLPCQPGAILDSPPQNHCKPEREQLAKDDEPQPAVDRHVGAGRRDVQVPHHLETEPEKRKLRDRVEALAPEHAAVLGNPALIPPRRPPYVAAGTDIPFRHLLLRAAAPPARAAALQLPGEDDQDGEQGRQRKGVRRIVPRGAVVADHVSGEGHQLAHCEGFRLPEHRAPDERAAGVVVDQPHRDVALFTVFGEQLEGRKGPKVGVVRVVGREQTVVERLREWLERRRLQLKVGAVRRGHEGVAGDAAAAPGVDVDHRKVRQRFFEHHVKVHPERLVVLGDRIGAVRVQRRVGIVQRDLQPPAALEVQNLRQVDI
ncbi:MAG: hypothetical protein CL844_06545 [Crocinitomicaceae bacterium]|nr:hypothetical protein [Crocinitomicaceae bacterium]